MIDGGVSSSARWSQCSGCGLCVVVCPVKCVSLVEDSEGFLVPVVSEGKCTRCGICLSRCPWMRTSDCGHVISEGFMVASKTRAGLSRSSSAGVFYHLAKWMMEEKGGTVFGAVLYPDGMVRHAWTESLDGIGSMQGSKYVQSDTLLAIEHLNTCMSEGRYALFSGTPCQIAAARSLVGELPNLLLVELICHGVPCGKAWIQEVNRLKERHKIDHVENVQFRSSSKSDRVRYGFSGGGIKSFIPWQKSIYYSLFMSGASLRECCYRCRFAGSVRVGDILIGDCSSAWQNY